MNRAELYLLARRGVRVVVLDFDPQCNISAIFLDEPRLFEIWEDVRGDATVTGCLELVRRGKGDVLPPRLERVADGLWLLPGHLALSRFEQTLAEEFAKTLASENDRALDVTTSLDLLSNLAAERVGADIMIMDLGPSLGALNRAALLACDHVVLPVAPDLFSLQGLRNVGPTLREWRRDWDTVRARGLVGKPQEALPAHDFLPLGYMVQQHLARADRPVAGYARWSPIAMSAGTPFKRRSDRGAKTPIQVSKLPLGSDASACRARVSRVPPRAAGSGGRPDGPRCPVMPRQWLSRCIVVSCSSPLATGHGALVMTSGHPSEHPSPAVAAQIQGFFGAHRSDLVRFATLQLRDPALAEDVVQETLIAVLQGQAEFANRSSVKTWVFSILKRKIIDVLRTRQREVPISQLDLDVEDSNDFDTLFDRRGHWATEHRPHRWADPDDSLEQQQFWRVFELCLDHLSERTSRVFMMREFLELETEEICHELAITTSNCWVILHRARMSLRLCIEETWFAR